MFLALATKNCDKLTMSILSSDDTPGVVGSFPILPPHMNINQFTGVTSGFTRLSMRTKRVCHGLIILPVNFHFNRTMKRNALLVKIGWWGKGKRAVWFLKKLSTHVASGLVSKSNEKCA